MTFLVSFTNDYIDTIFPKMNKKDVLPDKEDAGIPGQELADKVISKMKSYKEDLSHLNIIICGKTGVGKSTLINSVFCGNLADTGIGFPVTSEIRLFPDENFRTDIPLRIYDTPGFELDAVQRSSIKEQIHHYSLDKCLPGHYRVWINIKFC